MRVNVIHEGESYILQCGAGMQRVAWVARVAAQRLGSGGVWCPFDKVVGRPKEYIPGEVFYADGESTDPESTIMSLVEGQQKDDADLTLKVELLEKPAVGLPSLAAKGSEDSVVPPKNSKAAVSYHVTRGVGGSKVTRTPAPLPDAYRDIQFDRKYSEIDITDITQNADNMILDAVRNILMNNFNKLVDIFWEYAEESPSRSIQGAVGTESAPEHVVTMRQMTTFVRVCRLSSEDCSFYELQRAMVREPLRHPQAAEDESSLGFYDAEFTISGFFEALIRIAHHKNFGLSAICDQLNKLIHTQIMPFAEKKDDEDRIRSMTKDPKIQGLFNKERPTFRKFLTKKMQINQDKPHTRARTISLSEFIGCLKTSEQLDDELTPAAVKLNWLNSLTFDVRPDLISEDDNSLEVSLSEFEEIITRCVYTRSKVSEDNLFQQLDSFIKKFMRKMGEKMGL